MQSDLHYQTESLGKGATHSRGELYHQHILPAQKYRNSGKKPIKYSGKVRLVKCLKSHNADERIQQKAL